MNNPFDVIDARLSNIETLLLDIKHGSTTTGKLNKESVPDIYGVDTCKEVTGLAKPTIYRNTSKNLMPHYRRDGKLLFKRDEVYAWMTENRIKTQVEFSQELDTKLTNKKSRK